MLSSTLLLCSSLQLTPTDKQRIGRSASELPIAPSADVSSPSSKRERDVASLKQTPSQTKVRNPQETSNSQSSPAKSASSQPQSQSQTPSKMNFVRDLLQRSDSDLRDLHTLSALSTGSLSVSLRSDGGRNFAADQSPTSMPTPTSPGTPSPLQLLRGSLTMQLQPLKSPTEPKLSKSKSRSRTALNWPFKKLLKNESSVDSGIVVPSPTKMQRLFGQSLDLLCVDGKLPAPIMVSASRLSVSNKKKKSCLGLARALPEFGGLRLQLQT